MKKSFSFNRSIAKVFSLCALTFLTLFGSLSAKEVLGCTGVYIGREVSADGSYIIARSNDFQGVYPSRILVTPEKDLSTKRFLPINSYDGDTIPIPGHTHKYIGTPVTTAVVEKGKFPNFDEATCSNDQGITLSATVTASANAKAKSADPYPENGIIEDAIGRLLICQISSAKEGIELMASLVDEYGMNGAETLVIVDTNEAWYMELYTGHQYAAVKLPDDKVACYGNEFSLRFLSDYEDSICSKDIENLPKKNGFAVYGPNHELDLLETYSGRDTFRDYSHERTWIGHEILAKDKYGDYDPKAYFDFTYKPKAKVSVTDVMNLMRNRFEGTEFCPDTTGRLDIRVIGSESSCSVHVAQVYPDYPKQMACVTWLCEGPAPCGVFVPFSNACTEVSDCYGRDQSLPDIFNFDTANYPYYASKDLNTLALKNFDKHAIPIQNYWKEAEMNMTSSFAKLLKDEAKDYKNDPLRIQKEITSFCNEYQKTAFEDQKYMLNRLTYTLSYDSNSMRFGMNPETGELLTTPREDHELDIGLDSKKYAK